MKRYCGSPDSECEKGKQVYYAWLKKLGLDDTKPYRRPQEKFDWASKTFNLIKQDEDARYYKVEALFPTVSMNCNVYTEDELIRAARTLIGKHVNMNHTDHVLDGVEIVDAEFEDGAVEVLLRVSKDVEFNGAKIVDMIDEEEIMHVSIEGACRTLNAVSVDGNLGAKCEGLLFTGLALLTKDTLPGVPLTRIEPAESIVEGFTIKNQKEEGIDEKIEIKKQDEAAWDAAFINDLPDAAFAVIEPAYLRDETKDKRCRHLPHHWPSVEDPTENSSVDLPHLKNALTRVNQIKPVTGSISTEELRKRAKAHLIKHAKALLKTHQDQFGNDEKILILNSYIEDLEENLLTMIKLLEQQICEVRATITSKREVKEKVGNSNILTREGFWNRFRELRKEGLSKSEAYRLVCLELLKTLKSSTDAP